MTAVTALAGGALVAPSGSGPAGGAAAGCGTLALIAALGLLIAATAVAALPPDAAGTGRVARAAAGGSGYGNGRRSSPPRQVDPDAAGRARPRAPGCTPA